MLLLVLITLTQAELPGILDDARREEEAGRLFDALELYRQALELAPSDAELALRLAGVLARIGAHEEALDVLEDTRHDPASHLLSALLLRDLGRHQEAIELLELALAAGVDTPEICEELGFLLLATGGLERARELSRDALTRHPDAAGIKMVLGLTLITLPGERREGVSLLSQALEAGAPDRARVHLALGGALLDLGEIDEAVFHFREAARLRPESPETHFRLGTALRAAGELEAASEELSRFQELRRETDEAEAEERRFRTALNEAQKLALENRLAEALTRIDAVLESHPRDTRALSLRAKVLSSMGEDAEALASITRARELSPENVEHQYLEGRFLMKLGRFEDAGQSLRRALALDPSLGAAYELLGVVAANAKNYEEAAILLRRAIELGNDGASVRLNLSEVLRSLGRDEEAAEELEAFRRLSSKKL